VPTVIFFAKGSAVDRVDGVDIAAISSKSKKLAESASSAAATGQTLEDRLKALINTAPLMIFMKGDRNGPRCGFSKQLIAIVNDTKYGVCLHTTFPHSDQKFSQTAYHTKHLTS